MQRKCRGIFTRSSMPSVAGSQYSPASVNLMLVISNISPSSSILHNFSHFRDVRCVLTELPLVIMGLRQSVFYPWVLFFGEESNLWYVSVLIFHPLRCWGAGGAGAGGAADIAALGGGALVLPLWPVDTKSYGGPMWWVQRVLPCWTTGTHLQEEVLGSVLLFYGFRIIALWFILTLWK